MDTRDSNLPPPVRRDLRKPIVLLVCGLLLAGLGLAVVMNLDSAPEETAAAKLEITELLVEPKTLTDEELAAESGSIDQTSFDLPAGGWIQVAGEDGQLAQQYRFERLDPHPQGLGPGWLHMTTPELEIHLRDGRVMTLHGASAFAHAPNRAVVSGTLTGEVVIRLYEQDGNTRVDPRRDVPVLILRTPEAQFDNIRGEVRCDGDIEVDARGGEFVGRGLELLLNDQDNVIEHLRLDEVTFIRLASASSDATAAPADADVAVADDAAPSKTPAPRDRPRDSGDTKKTDDPVVPPFYRLVLHEDVKIVQGGPEGDRTALGHSLAVLFTMQSEGFGPVLTAQAPPPVMAPSAPLPRHEVLMAAVLAVAGDHADRLSPPPSPLDTVITCSGGLTMVPVTDPAEQLPSPRDARIDLIGDPVRLDDAGTETTATCATLRFDARPGAIELIGSADHALVLASPQLDATADRFRLVPSKRVGSFHGQGVVTVRSAGADEESLRIAWTDGGDLAFEPGVSGDGFGPLREATFRGHVEAASASLELPSSPRPDDPGTRPGALRCSELTAHFTPAPGDSDDASASAASGRIERLVASGDVEVTDGEQALWAQHLDVFVASGDEDAAIDRLLAKGDVQLRLDGETWVFGDELDVDGRRRMAVLDGDNLQIVQGEGVIDQATRVTVDEQRGVYVIEGRGRMRRFDRAVVTDTPERQQRRWFDMPGAIEELRLTWHDGAEIVDDADTGTTRARFTGDVGVVSRELKLTGADTLVAEIGPGDGDQRNLERIEATGGVHVRGAGDEGEAFADRLVVDLGRDEAGGVVPTRMTATGSVRVANASQTMWTERLVVTFAPRVGEPAPAADVDPNDPFATARVEVATLTANGGVQLRLADGERVFADALHARDGGDRAELVGERVMVLGEAYVLDDVRQLILDRVTGRYRVSGPGRFMALAEPRPLAAAAGTIEPPDVNTPTTLQAFWTESALFAEGDDGLGSLVLRGDVRAESRPAPSEYNTIGADELTLLFQSGGGDDDAPMGGNGELLRLQARGDAKLESRRSADVTDSGSPRVFYIAGPEIDYDQRTLEATVIGAGELLIRDEWAEADARSGFGTKGTTLLRWTDRLEMRRRYAERFVIAMTGDVTCVYRDLQGADSTLTGQRLEASVDRRVGDASDSTGGLDLGGSMALRRMFGDGGIYVRTPERDVTCDTFDYDLDTGLAEVSAAPGRLVSIISAEAGEPLRHERVIWNMRNDTITMYRGAATGAP